MSDLSPRVSLWPARNILRPCTLSNQDLGQVRVLCICHVRHIRRGGGSKLLKHCDVLTSYQVGDSIYLSNISIGFRVLGDTKTAPELAWA